METSITLLLRNQPGVLARATVALQYLGLRYRRYEGKDDTSRPGFIVVTLVAEGGSVSEADLTAKLSEIKGFMEVLRLEGGGATSQQASPDLMAHYLNTPGTGASTTSSMDSYFREQIRGLTNLITKLQGKEKVQILLTELDETAANVKWPNDSVNNDSGQPPEILPMQYQQVFKKAVDHAAELMGHPLVVKQLKAVEKRMRDEGENVNALSEQLGVTDILSIYA
jgi:hypothetical protein